MNMPDMAKNYICIMCQINVLHCSYRPLVTGCCFFFTDATTSQHACCDFTHIVFQLCSSDPNAGVSNLADVSNNSTQNPSRGVIRTTEHTC